MPNINDLLNDKELLHLRVEKRMIEELNRQKKSGKKFISDDDIDKLIDSVIKEELGDNWKEEY